jgi:hypothetical protein
MRKTLPNAALRCAGCACVALLTLASPSRSQSGANALQELGLLGTWASDCRQAASPMNNHATYSSTSSGGIQLRYQSGADYEDSIYDVLDARQVAADKVSMRQVLIGNDRVTLDIVLLKETDRIRIWSSAFPDGTTLVEEGVMTAFTGRETRWMTRCS